MLKKSVKRKIRYHVQRLPAADYGFPCHDTPPDSSFPDSVKYIKIIFTIFGPGTPGGPRESQKINVAPEKNEKKSKI